MNKKLNNEIYQTAQKIGLKYYEIQEILNNNQKNQTEDPTNTITTDIYKSGGWYGTISIKDFNY